MACAAWSADASALAVASLDSAVVTVRSAACGAAFSARLQAKVRPTRVKRL